jgi:hypothetical protein
MKVLLDECVPRKFKKSLIGHDCYTVPEAGLAGKTNGELLSLAEFSGFEIFLTVDHGIPYQQRLVGRRIAIVLLRVKSNQLVDLLPHGDSCLRCFKAIQPSEIVIIG